MPIFETTVASQPVIVANGSTRIAMWNLMEHGGACAISRDAIFLAHFFDEWALKECVAWDWSRRGGWDSCWFLGDLVCTHTHIVFIASAVALFPPLVRVEVVAARGLARCVGVPVSATALHSDTSACGCARAINRQVVEDCCTRTHAGRARILTHFFEVWARRHS